MRIRVFYLLVPLVLIASVVLAYFRSDATNAGSLLPESLYVWNRVQSDDFRESLRFSDERFCELSILAGEVQTNRNGDAVIASNRVALDLKSFSKLSSPITLCFRLQSWEASYDDEAAAFVALLSMINRYFEEAAMFGTDIAGIQVDFDCPTSKLDQYAIWLARIRKRIPDVTFSITALPTWMGNSEFLKLIEQCDYYVLQVHSLIRPNTIEDEVTIFDGNSALRWIKLAERLKRPYKIALPTYSYWLEYDDLGSFMGLIAEGAFLGSGVSQHRIAGSDPKMVAETKQALEAMQSNACIGLIWFRMPVRTDRLNWDWSTLDAVRSNTIDDVAIVLEFDRKREQLFSIKLRNPSNVQQRLPKLIQIPYPKKGDANWDVIRCYTPFSRTNAGMIVLERIDSPSFAYLRAGESLTLGWIRSSENLALKEGEI